MNEVKMRTKVSL